MSADAWARIRWARDCASEYDLPPTAAHVLLVLATYADEAGECYPGRGTIAAAVRRKDSQVGDALARLKRVGLIERKEGGPGRTALTRLRAPGLDHRPTGDQDHRPTGDQGRQDHRPTGAKTTGPPAPRPPAHRRENYQGNSQGNGERAPTSTDEPSKGDSLSNNDQVGGQAEYLCEVLAEAVMLVRDGGGRFPTPVDVKRILDERHPVDPALAEKAAWEARRLVLAQDRAPNIVGLFERLLTNRLQPGGGAFRRAAETLRPADQVRGQR